jgi:pimeloyl-ACP methyl ester carboxylesterase
MVLNWESTNWLSTLIQAGRRIIAMDVRGHGHSGKLYDPSDYRPHAMASDAANLLDHLSLSAVDVMGYSMGARISACLTLARPELVRSLVFGGMAMGLVEGIGGEEEIIAALEAESLDQVTGRSGRAYRIFADQTRSDLRALAACMRAQRELISAEELATIVAPVLIAVGTRDSVAGSASQLAAIMRHARAVDIPGRDHLLATGDKVYKAAVLEFLPK